MRGIRIRSGALFLKRGHITLRYSDGRWEVSPVMLDVLEWDLRTEPPSSYDDVFESDIKALGEDVYEEAVRKLDELDKLLG